MEITLDMLLASRDSRQAKQMALMSAHPGHTLVCLTVVMPGAVKRNLHSLIVANAALTAVLECFRQCLVDIEVRDLVTGYEAYLVVDMNPMEAKKLSCQIEDSHPLGRLFDIDILAADGTPLSREQVGDTPRQCLLCEHESRWCMRNHTHTQAELHTRINEMIEDYVR
ncbi:MAG: citrate lyase holo-[Muribaculaceae bacterium]|nr:citrate lyase holo-[acyl-carrier protein] synthase [Muribaculaceae bacterium]MBR1726318.1 citrate lyase holo-[acyl-carrier protein] synthase [Muribaculaceae bacterium]